MQRKEEEMKKILIVALLAFALVGCTGGSKEVTKVCTFEVSGTKTSMELVAKDGKTVSEIIQTASANLEELGVSEEAFQEIVSQLKGKFNVDGVVYTVDVKDGIATEKWIIDVKKAGTQQLADMGMMQSGADIIDLNESVKQLTASGFTCK